MNWMGRAILILMVWHVVETSLSVEEAALAQIIQGKAHHQFMRDDGAAAYAVGWVARNRLESGQYGGSYQELRSEFNGTVNRAASLRYKVIARMVINNEEDPTGGALYVFSQQDVDRLGFGEEEATLILVASEHRALYFFRRWPGDYLRSISSDPLPVTGARRRLRAAGGRARRR
jgi:hypothetical protein